MMFCILHVVPKFLFRDMPWYSPINKYLIYQVDFQLNYKLKNKIDKFSRRSNYDSTMHILKINFKRFVQKSQKAKHYQSLLLMA